MCAHMVEQDPSKIDTSGFDSAPDAETERQMKDYLPTVMSLDEINAEPDPDIRERLKRLAANKQKIIDSYA